MSLPYSKHNPIAPCCACGRHPTTHPEVETVWAVGEHGLCDLCAASLRADGITPRFPEWLRNQPATKKDR